jgi:hypothetical protein
MTMMFISSRLEIICQKAEPLTKKTFIFQKSGTESNMPFIKGAQQKIFAVCHLHQNAYQY